MVGEHDVRGEGMGLRVITDLEVDFKNIINTDKIPEANGTYSYLRTVQGLGEGGEVEGGTAVERNGDICGYVSFDKGCYLGQEFTARSYFKGVVRKRTVPAVVGRTDGEGRIEGRNSAMEVAQFMWINEDLEGGVKTR